jgi:hypothetical protein
MTRTAPSLDIEIPADRSDLTVWTPQQVDMAISEIQDRAWYILMDAMTAETSAVQYRSYADGKGWNRHASEADTANYLKQAEKYDAKAEALHVQYRTVMAEANPFHVEYASRPWTRAWIVTSSDGHVHNTQSCSTCNKTYLKADGTYSAPTRFGWLPQVSGLDEATIVDLAGEAACTVCYPTAPAASLLQPNLLDTAERAALKVAKSAEKDAKTAERIAKGVTPDGTPLVVRWEYQSTRWARQGDDPALVVNGQVRYTQKASKTMKTERAAELFAVEALAGRSYDAPTSTAIQEVIAALAWKRGTTQSEVFDYLKPKVTKKRRSA